MCEKRTYPLCISFFITKWIIQNHARVNTLTDNGAETLLKRQYTDLNAAFSMRRNDYLTPAAFLWLLIVWICDFMLFSRHKKPRDKPGIFIRSDGERLTTFTRRAVIARFLARCCVFATRATAAASRSRDTFFVTAHCTTDFLAA